MADQRMRYVAQRQAGEAPPESAGQSQRKKGEDEIWVRKEYLLFDLDGTLTDPKQGITKCVQYALRSFGIDEPDLDKLEPFIGPPLKKSFMEFYGFDDDKAELAVAKYRERFKDTGIFENEIYRGVPEMLKKLKMRGLRLGVASSKPTVFVERILEHFRIREYFDVVVGSELDGSRSEKPEIVTEALRRLFPSGYVMKHKVFMIGDRKFDVEGAKAVGVESVGVSYGYGSMEELMGAHADYIVRSIEELRRFLLRGFEDMAKDLGTFQKTWILVSQFILFVAARGLTVNLLLLLLGGETVNSLSDDVRVLISGAGALAGGLAVFKAAKGCIKRTIQDMYLTHLKEEPKSIRAVLAVATVFFSMGFSMLLNLSGFAKDVSAFQLLPAEQVNASLIVALLIYGVLTPVAEELLFRGTIYGYVRKFFDVRTAIIGSAILYGILQKDLALAVNATVMGYFMAYAYEYFGSFMVPIVMHVGMAVLTIVIDYVGLTKTKFVCWPVCIAMLLLGVIGFGWLARRKRVS